jgi:hypothetical protein
MVKKGEIGPVMLGRDHHDTGGTDSPFRETSNIKDGSNVMAEMATQCYAGNAARGMSLVTLHNGGGVGIGFMINATGKYFCDNELKDISRSNNPYNSHNLNYMINFGAAYSLSNKWNVFAGFNYKSNITSIIKPEYDSGIKYKATGFNLGLSYIIK